MEFMLRPVFPVLLTVTVFAAAVVPTAVLPLQFSEVGDRVRTGRRPVPDSATVPEVAGAATFTLNVALLAPAVVGLNVTLIVQVKPTPRVAGLIGQLLA